MATNFKLKRSSVANKRPGLTNLELGELALNTYDGYLFSERDGLGITTITNLTPWFENYGAASIVYNNSVGIGTTDPIHKLDLRGSLGGIDNIFAPHVGTTKTFTVKVVTKTAKHRYNGSGSSLGYTVDGEQSPLITLTPGRTYRFDQADNSNSSHQIRFYLEADKTTLYSSGVTYNGTAGQAGSYTQIVVGDETPVVLHYQCVNHAYMGNAAQNNSNVVNTNYAATLRGGLDVTGNISLTGSLSGFTDQSAPFGSTKTYTVTVASKDSTHRYNGSGSGSAYLIDGIQSPILTLTPGRTYRFTNNNTGSHPLKFYLEADKTTNYTTGVNFQNSYTEITVGDETPNVLHYQCTAHSLMGNAIVANSNVVNSNYAATLRGGLSVTGGETTLSSATVSDLTSGRVVFAGGSGVLQDSGNLLFNGTDLSAASLIVSDLTDGRVVIAGGSGAVNDSANLKFNTTTSEFEVVGHSVLDTVVASGIVTASSFRGDGSQLTGITTAFGNSSVNSTGIATFSRLSTGASEVGINITGNTITGPQEMFIDPAAVGLNTGSVRIKGDLYVDGATISVNTGDVEFGDFVVGIASTVPTNALLDGAGIGIGSTGIRKFIRYNNASDTLQSSIGFSVPDSGAFKTGTAIVLNKTTLGTTVVNSSLTSVGTLGALTVSGQTVVGSGVTLNATGVIATGVITATSFIGDGSSLTGIDASALKFGGAVKAQANGFGVIVTGVTTSSGGFSGNLTGTATLATDLAINGTNQLLYQAGNNNSAILPTGTAGQILSSSGSGSAPQWVTSAPAGAIEGITIRDESAIVGTANSISTINFLGDVVTADAATGAGIATVTISAMAGIGVSMGGGSVGTAVTAFDFEGSLVSVDAVSNTGIATVRVEGLSIKDEGSTVGTAGSITTINFVGSGIAAAVSGDTATVTSSGGVTNADVVALAIALG